MAVGRSLTMGMRGGGCKHLYAKLVYILEHFGCDSHDCSFSGKVRKVW